MITYQQFYRRYGVRKSEQLMMFKQRPLRGCMLPNRPVIHYMPSNIQETKVDLNDYFISSHKGLMYCMHQTELKSFIGNPVRNSTNSGALVRTLEKSQRTLRRVRQFATVNKDLRAALIINYASLQPLYRYRISFMTSWQRWANIFATMVANIKELSAESDRHHYLRFDIPEFLPTIAQLNMGQRGISKMVVETLRTPEAFFVLELWKWAQRLPSLLDGLPQEHLDHFSLLVVDADRIGVLNFGQLAEWRAAETRVDENGEVRGVGRFYRQLLYFFVQFIKARTDDPVANELKETPAETAEMGKVLDDLSGEPKTEDQLDSEADEILDRDATQAQAEIDKLSEELDEIAGDAGVDEVDVTDDSIFETARPVSQKEAVVQQTSGYDVRQPPEEGVQRRIDQLTNSGVLSSAEQKRYQRLATTYRDLTNPYGKGTVASAIQHDPKEVQIDPAQTKLEDIEGVLDKTMLADTMTVFDEQYIEKVLHRDVLRSVMAFQRDGTTVTDVKVTRVTDAMNKYDVMTIKLQPVNGKPTTLNIKIPVVKKDGTWVADGVTYRLRKQRRDYPISKTAPDEVALSTYLGKMFISRSEKVVHDFDRWLQNKIILEAMSPDTGLSDISYRAHRNKAEIPPLPRLYTGLAKRFNAFTANGYRVYVDYVNRSDFFTPEEFELEKQNQGLALFAKGNGSDTKGKVLLVDEHGTLYVSSGKGVAVFGDIGTLTGIDLAKAPLQQTVVKLLGKSVPLGVVLCYYFGLEGALQHLKAKVRRIPRGQRLDLEPDEYPVRFQDEVLVLSKQDRAASLLFAGFSTFARQTNHYPIAEYNKKDIYLNLFESIGLGVRYIRELDHLDRFFIDPMTLKILVEHNEPTDFVGLLVKANSMLTTDYVEKKRRLLKGYERMAAAVYREVAQASRDYNSRPNSPRYGVDIKPTAVWQAIQQDPSISLVQNINPIHNLKEQEAVTESGTGGRSSRTMTAPTRAYDPNDFGVISEATVDSSDVAVSTFTSSDPNIVSLTGETRPYDKSKDGINTVMSTAANVSPCAVNDDPKRVNFISIQHSSGIAAVGYQHQPIRTGYDQVLAQRVTDLYAFAARKPGVVKEVSPTHLLVEYEDGELVGVELGRRFGHAEGSVIPHTVTTDVIAGLQFKRGHVLAWNSGWFVRDFFDETQVLWKNACLMTVALMDVPETYEDSHAISKNAAKRMLSYGTKIKTIHLKFNQKVSQLVKEGEDVDAEQILCMIEDSLTADTGLFNDENVDMLRMLSAQTPRAGYTGKVEKIEVLYRGDKEDMSETLQEIVGLYDRKRALQAKRLRSDDATTGRVIDSVRVDGIILEPDTVAIRIYITYPVEFGVADKSVFGLQLKTVNGQVFDGENTTESGEPIDAKFSNMSVFNRIVDSAYRIGCATRVLLKGSKNAAKIYKGEK